LNDHDRIVAKPEFKLWSWSTEDSFTVSDGLRSVMSFVTDPMRQIWHFALSPALEQNHAGRNIYQFTGE
jgi:hypothetical protein